MGDFGETQGLTYVALPHGHRSNLIQDYSLRAKDFHDKRRRLSDLRKKASERNPDEFHFAMMSSRTRNGGQKVAERGNKSLSHDAVRLLKTQDAGYLRTMAQRTRKLREKLEQSIVMGDGTGPAQALHVQTKGAARQHLAFVDTKAEQENWPAKSPLNLGDNNVGSRTHDLSDERNREPTTTGSSTENEDDVDSGDPGKPPSNALDLREARAIRKRRKRHREARINLLEALRKREGDLRAAELELDVQRIRMNHGSSKAGLKTRSKRRKK